MKKAALLIAVGLLVGGAWWLRREQAPELKAPSLVAATPPASPAAPALRLPVSSPTPAEANAPSLLAKKLELKDDALRSRLDEVIPNRLYAEAAKCYHGGGDRDDRLDLSYRISVADGAVSFSNLTVTDSTLKDHALERCIKDRIVNAKWRDEELPDLDEEDDLFMRVYNLKMYAANDDPASAR